MDYDYKSKEFPVERIRELYDYDDETGYLLSRDSRWAGRPVNGSRSKDDRKWMVKLFREDGSYLRTNYGRVVFAWHYGRWPDGSIDHIDRNPRNNRVENLREADRTLQAQNRGNYNYGTSWRKAEKKWTARVIINGERKFLGLYQTQKAAQEAVMAACDEIGREYLPPYLFGDRYVPAERVMGIR
jgi:hypothetical protein